MIRINWKLARYLETHDIRPRDVENEAIRAGFQFGRNTIYRLLRDDGPTNFNRDTLAAVIASLRAITGQTVTADDLLEVIEEPSPKLVSLKPGEVGDTKLRSEPPSVAGKPRGLGAKRIVPKGGALVSTAVREARDERERKL